MKQILTLITILLLLISLPLVAQKNVVITGIVRDSLNQPMPGATVVIKDTQIATMCNLEGEYTITIPASKINKNMILVFWQVKKLTS